MLVTRAGGNLPRLAWAVCPLFQGARQRVSARGGGGVAGAHGGVNPWAGKAAGGGDGRVTPRAQAVHTPYIRDLRTEGAGGVVKGADLHRLLRTFATLLEPSLLKAAIAHETVRRPPWLRVR